AELQAKARRGPSARALVFALLIGREPNARRAGVDWIRSHVSGALQETEECLAILDGFDARVRLPLTDLALPALRQMPEPDREEFLRQVKGLIDSDDCLTLFEFAIQRVLRMQ